MELLSLSLNYLDLFFADFAAASIDYRIPAYPASYLSHTKSKNILSRNGAYFITPDT
jgi:hypothetical protein